MPVLRRLLDDRLAPALNSVTGQVDMPAKRLTRVPGVFATLAAAALLASCAASGPGPQSTPAAERTDGAVSGPVRIRLALAPDPIWEWLEDSGTVAEWEAAHNIQVEASSPFDPFSAFVGGHVDVVVINALEVPQIAEQPGLEPVIFGQFTADRSFLAVRRTSTAETLDDLVESRIAVDSSLGRVLLWDLIADSMHDLELRVGSSDFDLMVVEAGSVADVLMRGDAEACICLPEFGVTFFADGVLRPLYGGRTAAEIYAEDVVGDPQTKPIADAFVADKQWLAQNRDAVDALLELWQAGLENWATGKEQLIIDYAHLFSVQTDEEIDWISDYVKEQDWVFPSIYLTQQNSAVQADMFARMHGTGLLPDDASAPQLDLSFSADS